MITKTKQDWTPGKAVKVGFLTLTVLAAVPTPGDYMPDAYVLASKAQFFKFVPHNGLEKITADEARELIEDGRRIAKQIADKAMAAAKARAEHSNVVAALLAA